MADWLARQKLAAAGLPTHAQPYRAGSMQSGAWTYGQVAMGSSPSVRGGAAARPSQVVGSGGMASGVFVAELGMASTFVLDPRLMGAGGSGSGTPVASGSGSVPGSSS